jgi:hypothetical protein
MQFPLACLPFTANSKTEFVPVRDVQTPGIASGMGCQDEFCDAGGERRTTRHTCDMLHGMLRKLRSSKCLEQDACEEKDTRLSRIQKNLSHDLCRNKWFQSEFLFVQFSGRAAEGFPNCSDLAYTNLIYIASRFLISLIVNNFCFSRRLSAAPCIKGC